MSNYIESIRVLVIDDNKEHRDKFASWFETTKRPFLVDKASSYDDALKKINLHSYHVVVTDLNLTGGEHNIDGMKILNILSERQPANTMVKVLLSGETEIADILSKIRGLLAEISTQYLNKRASQEGINVFDIIFFYKHSIEKDAFMEIILHKLDSLRINFELVINPDHIKDALIDNLAKSLIEDVDKDIFPIKDWIKDLSRNENALKQRITEEFTDLFRHLFYDKKNITLQKLGQGFGHARVVKVAPSDRSRPQVVKFGYWTSEKRDDVEIENDRYHEYVVGRLINVPELRAKSKTSLLSGICYDFAGGAQQLKTVSFGEYFKKIPSNKTENIKATIDYLFNVTSKHWYDQSPNENPYYSFSKEYAQFLHCTPKRVFKSLEILYDVKREYNLEFEGQTYITFSDPSQFKPIRYPNPVFMLANGEDWKDLGATVRRCITHGDFNGQNIFIDETQKVWLIDFFRVGQEDIHRDFIQLESVIRFMLLKYDEATFLERYEMEQELNRQTRFSDIVDESKPITRYSPKNAKLRRAFEVICKIRQVAYGLTVKQHYDNENNDFRGYKMGLLFYALNTLKFVEKKEDIQAVNGVHALLLASMLAQDFRNVIK
jgi:CheY-like chemotaxis protein